jgi:hypothetical protein
MTGRGAEQQAISETRQTNSLLERLAKIAEESKKLLADLKPPNPALTVQIEGG